MTQKFLLTMPGGEVFVMIVKDSKHVQVGGYSKFSSIMAEFIEQVFQPRRTKLEKTARNKMLLKFDFDDKFDAVKILDKIQKLSITYKQIYKVGRMMR